MWKSFKRVIHSLNSSLKIIRKNKIPWRNRPQFQPWNRMIQRTIARNNWSNYIPASSIIRPVDSANRRDKSSSFLVHQDLLLLVESQVGPCRSFAKYGEERKKKKEKERERSKGKKIKEKRERKELISWLRALDTGNSILFKSFSSQVFCSSKRRTEAAC